MTDPNDIVDLLRTAPAILHEAHRKTAGLRLRGVGVAGNHIDVKIKAKLGDPQRWTVTIRDPETPTAAPASERTFNDKDRVYQYLASLPYSYQIHE